MEFTYKGLKAELNKHIVTDEEVDKQIERVRSQNPRIVPFLPFAVIGSRTSCTTIPNRIRDTP